MELQFVLVIYYLTLVRKSLINYQCMHQYIYIKIYTLRAFQILKYLVALIFIRVHSTLFFATSQLRPFHIGCPDPGHGTRNYVRDGNRICQPIIVLDV